MVVKLKHIGAYFLLFIYSIAFGHQILPHHHHEGVDQHDHDHPVVHNHCDQDNESHDHVLHKDHFDEGIIDFLACVFGNHQHNSASEYEFIQSATDQKTNTKFKSIIVNDVVLLQTQLLTEFTSLVIPNYSYSFNEKSALFDNCRAKRGPPQA